MNMFSLKLLPGSIHCVQYSSKPSNFRIYSVLCPTQCLCAGAAEYLHVCRCAYGPCTHITSWWFSELKAERLVNSWISHLFSSWFDISTLAVTSCFGRDCQNCRCLNARQGKKVSCPFPDAFLRGWVIDPRCCCWLSSCVTIDCLNTNKEIASSASNRSSSDDSRGLGLSQTLERSSSAEGQRGEMVWLGVKYSCLGGVLPFLGCSLWRRQ